MPNPDLKSSFINKDENAPVMVIFGGNTEMRNHVVNMIEDYGKVTVHAALSEEEGISLLDSLPKVQFVLIGGRYSMEQRIRIKKITAEKWPRAFTSEPGIDYTYGDDGVLNDLKTKLKL